MVIINDGDMGRYEVVQVVSRSSTSIVQVKYGIVSLCKHLRQMIKI